MKKKIKKIVHNCPYITALLGTWLFLTAGGIALLIYRGHGEHDPKTFWEHPFFAVIMEQEIHGSAGSASKVEAAMAGADRPEKSDGDQNIDKITKVTLDETGDGPSGIRQTGNVREKEADPDRAEPDTEPGLVREKQVRGRTIFATYTPVETHSIYYTDVGEVALTTDYPYTTVGEDYFEDAAFIGDSRTLGISDYSGLDADFYCENGMTIYKMFDEKGIVYQKSGEKVNLLEALQQKKYGKIYIMLGMNELGYRDTNYFMEKYRSGRCSRRGSFM